MISLSLANHLRENHDEVIRRWFENLHGYIAEDFEQMLKTAMGGSVANKLLSGAIEFLEAEDYRKPEILHGFRDLASDAAFRRTAVGFGLPDIVATATAFRHALEETLLYHAIRGTVDHEHQIIEGIMAINQLGDVLVSGEIAGYFAYLNFRQADG